MCRAAREVHDGPADGTSVYFAALGPMVLKPNVTPNGNALKPKDFRAVCRATYLPIILVASKNAPFKTYKEFEAYAKAHPGKVRVALTNFPSSIHSGMTYFVKNLAKLDVKLVTQANNPLDGAIDTLTGETDVLITHTRTLNASSSTAISSSSARSTRRGFRCCQMCRRCMSLATTMTRRRGAASW